MARRSEIEQSMLGRFLAFKRQKHSHRPLNSSPSMHGASAIIKTKRRISKISNEIDHCLHRISGRRSIRLPASKISKLLRCIDARVVEHKQAVSALHKLAPHSQLHAVRPYIKRRKQSKLERTGPDLALCPATQTVQTGRKQIRYEIDKRESCLASRSVACEGYSLKLVPTKICTMKT